MYEKGLTIDLMQWTILNSFLLLSGLNVKTGGSVKLYYFAPLSNFL